MAPLTVDMHCHVAIPGQPGSELGFISQSMLDSVPFQIFLLYNRLKASEVSDDRLRTEVLRVIGESSVNRVVCLALDAVYDTAGSRRLDLTTMYVPNEFVLGLRAELPDRILYGASVHPYDPHFADRVKQAVDDGAVLLKWLPSAQQIDLADPRVLTALQVLADAGAGGFPLPLLLHVGFEGSIISTDRRTMSYDYLSWGLWDRIRNVLRRPRWHVPDLAKVHANLEGGLQAGACIIFTHCGLPFFATNLVTGMLEHSELKAVGDYLRRFPGQSGTIRGKAFTDLSACVTPFRERYFEKLGRLPAGSLLVGSDFPVPIFELSADRKENLRDLKAIVEGHLERVVVPQDNLLDVNLRELQRAFPGHPMFGNALQFPNWN